MKTLIEVNDWYLNELLWLFGDSTSGFLQWIGTDPRELAYEPKLDVRHQELPKFLDFLELAILQIGLM